MLNSNGWSGHPCLAPVLRVNAYSFSPLRIMFSVGLLYMAFIMLRHVPFVPTFWRVFIINNKNFEFWTISVEFYQKLSLHLLSDHMVFTFQFVNMVYPVDWFAYVEESYFSGVKPTWSWCIILLMCCWILFVRILLRIFASCSPVILAYNFLFCMLLSSGFGMRVKVAS